MYSCVVVSIAQDVIYGHCTQQLLDKPTYETQPRKVSSCILLAFIAAFHKNKSATTPALASWLPEALLLNGQALHNMRYIKHLRPAGMIHGLVYNILHSPQKRPPELLHWIARHSVSGPAHYHNHHTTPTLTLSSIS